MLQPRTVRNGHARRCASSAEARTTAGQAEPAAASVLSTRPHRTRASEHPAQYVYTCVSIHRARSSRLKRTHSLRAHLACRATPARGSLRRRTPSPCRRQTAPRRTGRRCAAQRRAARAARPPRRSARACRWPARHAARSPAWGSRRCRDRWVWPGIRRRRRGGRGTATALRSATFGNAQRHVSAHCRLGLQTRAPRSTSAQMGHSSVSGGCARELLRGASVRVQRRTHAALPRLRDEHRGRPGARACHVALALQLRVRRSHGLRRWRTRG